MGEGADPKRVAYAPVAESAAVDDILYFEPSQLYDVELGKQPLRLPTESSKAVTAREPGVRFQAVAAALPVIAERQQPDPQADRSNRRPAKGADVADSADTAAARGECEAQAESFPRHPSQHPYHQTGAF